MSEKKKPNIDDLLKSLNEIDVEEKQLKRRKVLLQRQKPWYTNPTNIIGLATILVTVFISLFSIIGNTKSLELTCSYSDPKPLTNFSSKIQDNILIKYKDLTVLNLGKMNITIQNTGSEGLTRDDFADGPIEFVITNSELIKNDSLRKAPFLLDIAVLNNANQRNDLLQIQSYDCNSKFTYIPSLINAGDKIELELYISNINSIKTAISGNISNGQIKVEKETIEVEKSKLKTLGLAIVNIFGTKWIPLIILFVMFLLSILKTFMVILEEFELNLIDITFGTLFIISDILLLISLIAVIRV